jgi:fatty acid desaturase
MNTYFELTQLTALLAISGLLMAHLKAKASSGLLHHATHGRLFANPRTNRLTGELVGILTLSQGFDAYRGVHGKHHGYTSFAQVGLDEEADGLVKEGFAPGRSQRVLWWLFFSKPFNPAWHARQAWGRLEANFFSGPWLRRAAAWGVWGGAALAAAASDWLAGFVGAAGLMLVAGSVASYLELTSRHIWAVAPASTGRARQLELSHWRLPAPEVPTTWGLKSTLRFAGSVFAKALWRFAATPLDLPHHPAHHLAWDAKGTGAAAAWADAAQAYSERLRNDTSLHAHVHGSLLGAVGAWFKALEQAPKLNNEAH